MNVTTKMTVASILANQDWTPQDGTKVLIDLGSKEVKDSGRMWRTVCAMILRNPLMLQQESLDDFMSMFGDMLEASLPSGTDVPIAKSGATKGKPSFRSWPVTKPRWQYANYIYNAIAEKGSPEAVFPHDQPLPTLAEVRKMKPKKAEAPLDTIKRCLTLCEQKLDEIGKNDTTEVDALVQGLMVKWATRISEL